MTAEFRAHPTANRGHASGLNALTLARDLHLVAIVDLFSRNVLSWRLSNSLDMEFSLEALGMALEGGR